MDEQTDNPPTIEPELAEPKQAGFLKRNLVRAGLYFSLLGPPTPFKRLAVAHALSTAGDAMIVLALSNSLFFSIDPSAARIRVLLYLVLTMAPFTVVAPLIGPVLDSFKGGRRVVVVLMNVGRTITAVLMIGRQDSLLLFPLAFLILILGKSYSVAKASIVPSTGGDRDELVRKNSKLAVLSGIMGFFGIVIALPFNFLGGTSWVVGLAALTWTAATLASLKLYPVKRVPTPVETPEVEAAETTETETAETETEAAEPNQPPKAPPPKVKRGLFYLLIGRTTSRINTYGILATTNTMAMLRGILGFMGFLIAFGFRGGTDDIDLSGIGTAVGAGVKDALGYNVETDTVESPLRLIVLAGVVVIGSLIGSSIAPKLRRAGKEENILLGGLLIIALVGIFISWIGVYVGGICLGFSVGLSVSAGKVGFDSIVQRDTNEADYGKSFGGFETYFQLTWVVGAILPVLIPIPPNVGYLVVGAFATTTWVVYFLKNRRPRSKQAAQLLAEPQPPNIEPANQPPLS